MSWEVMNLEVTRHYMTKNECFLRGKFFSPTGVMLHSTGANNPRLSRYVQPDDGRLGDNPYENHFNTPRPGGRKVCPHAIIGKLADGTVAAYQLLPWEMVGWHAGGSANDTHIGIEICEDDLADKVYFQSVYALAVELTAYLCREFGLDPLDDGVVICHREGHARGVASNHGDVMHWFPRHGKTMDNFRADVARTMKQEDFMTQRQFDFMLEDWLARQNEKIPTQRWLLDGVAKAKAAGISDGSRPMGLCTRAEAMMMAAAAKK